MNNPRQPDRRYHNSPQYPRPTKYHNSPRAKIQKPPFWSNRKVLDLAILASSPIWVALYFLMLILLLPIIWKRYPRFIRNNISAFTCLNSFKRSPKPPRRETLIDPELECRRAIARCTQNQRYLVDPICFDPACSDIIKDAGRRARQELGHLKGMGINHWIWMRQKKILLEDYGIIWYSPRQMNPKFFL
jgi:hypothetical protein